ncbi:MAG: sulfotransferase [Candidatus Competibacteraceae bacterium]|nr:sulfotransferase [Candidatus Competibacteraceae bacterium]
MYSPLFILCPGRSFSSVVSAAIGQHPQLYDVPEIYLAIADSVGELLIKAGEQGKKYFAYGLVRVIAQLHHNDQSEESAQSAWSWLRHHRSWTTRQLYYHIAERIAPKRLVDKSPTHGHIENLERLRAIFPNAFFLHLLRHPRTTTHSLYKVHSQRLAMRQPEKIPRLGQRVEKQWLKVHRNIIAFSSQLPLGRMMRIQGEALLTDPDSYFSQIAEWLEIRNDAAAIEAMKHPERSPYATLGPPSAPYGNNTGFLENPALRIGRPMTGPLGGPLVWAERNDGFCADTLVLARQFGYR